MNYIIEFERTKRIIDNCFQINGTRKDLKILRDCLTRALEDDRFTCGWVSIHEECSGSDTPPIRWK